MLNVIALAAAAFVATNVDNLFVLLAFVAGARGRWTHVVIGQFAGSLALMTISILLAAWLTQLPDGYAGLLGVLPIGVGISQAWARFRTAPVRVDDTLHANANAGNETETGTTANPDLKPQTTHRHADTPHHARRTLNDASRETNPTASSNTLPSASVDTTNTALTNLSAEASVTATGKRHEPPRSSWWTVAWVALANGSDNLAVYTPLYTGHSHREWAWITLVFVAMTGVWCAGAIWLVAHPLLGAPIRRYGAALLPLILVVIGMLVIAHNDTLRIVFGI